jgi:hypothetical protein
METVNRGSIQQFAQSHPRLICWLLVLLGIGLTVYEWHAIRSEHFYSPIAAIIGPLCAMFFAGLAIFGGQKTPSSQQKAKKVLAALAIAGVIAGFFNLYAMTH